MGGGDHLPILMDNVKCKGGIEENSDIQECEHKDEHNCGHSEDVGVICQ